MLWADDDRASRHRLIGRRIGLSPTSTQQLNQGRNRRAKETRSKPMGLGSFCSQVDPLRQTGDRALGRGRPER
jgi:hypothetical protein